MQKGLELEERDYFKDPLSREELLELVKLSSLSELFAWRSPSFKKTGLTAGEISEDEMLRMILEEPRLMRRPVTRVGDKLIIGSSPKMMEQELSSLQ